MPKSQGMGCSSEGGRSLMPPQTRQRSLSRSHSPTCHSPLSQRVHHHHHHDSASGYSSSDSGEDVEALEGFRVESPMLRVGSAPRMGRHSLQEEPPHTIQTSSSALQLPHAVTVGSSVADEDVQKLLVDRASAEIRLKRVEGQMAVLEYDLEEAYTAFSNEQASHVDTKQHLKCLTVSLSKSALPLLDPSFNNSPKWRKRALALRESGRMEKEERGRGLFYSPPQTPESLSSALSGELRDHVSILETVMVIPKGNRDGGTVVLGGVGSPLEDCSCLPAVLPLLLMDRGVGCLKVHAPSLVCLPPDIVGLPALEFLRVAGCKGLVLFPDSCFTASLLKLDLSHTAIVEISPAIANAVSLRTLVVHGCLWLEFISTEVEECRDLSRLDITACPRLEVIPRSCAGLVESRSSTLPGNSTGVPSPVVDRSPLSEGAGCSEAVCTPQVVAGDAASGLPRLSECERGMVGSESAGSVGGFSPLLPSFLDGEKQENPPSLCSTIPTPTASPQFSRSPHNVYSDGEDEEMPINLADWGLDGDQEMVEELQRSGDLSAVLNSSQPSPPVARCLPSPPRHRQYQMPVSSPSVEMNAPRIPSFVADAYNAPTLAPRRGIRGGEKCSSPLQVKGAKGKTVGIMKGSEASTVTSPATAGLISPKAVASRLPDFI